MNKIVNDFIVLNYKKIIIMSKKIVKNSNDYEEVCHYVIEQFMINPKSEELIKRDEAMKYISGMIYNSYHSASSPFIRMYRPHLDGKELYKEDISEYKDYLIDNQEYDYEKDILINKIQKILNEKHDVETWFNLTLLKLYVENPNYVSLSKQVKIPRTTISIAVRAAIKYIKERI